jgi:hypothetical protein
MMLYLHGRHYFYLDYTERFLVRGFGIFIVIIK